MRRPRQKWSIQAKIITRAPLLLLPTQAVPRTGLRKEVARLSSHKGMTSRCQLAKNWGLRPQLTTCTSQMSIQRKEGCSNRETPEEHRLRVQAGSVLADRWALLPREAYWAAVPSCPHLPFSSLHSRPLSHLHMKVKLNPQWPCAMVSPQSVPPKSPQEGEEGSQRRCCIGGGHALGGCRPG